MSCERLQKGLLGFMLIAACSREVPLQEQQQQPAAPVVKQTAPPVRKTYDEAVTWFRTTPGFRFVVDEGGVRAEGEMSRENVGAERVTVTVNGEQWTATSGVQGVTWRRGGQDAPAPEWGNRLFQRVTVAFDPQKQEGAAQEVEPGHFRFTDANSGRVHEVRTNAEGQIERLTIGDAVTMTLSNQK